MKSIISQVVTKGNHMINLIELNSVAAYIF